jgi:PhnB protein
MHPNLHFKGNAEEVLRHYRAAFGGDVEIVRFAGTPAAESAPPDWADKVLYGTLRSPLGVINIMDAPCERAEEPGGNVAIAVLTTSEAQTDAVFSQLSAGGRVTMPLEQTFWAAKFGMCTDKFGTKWMVNYQG